MSKRGELHFDADFNAPEVIADPFPTLTEELLSSCVLLLFAGHETTTQLFGNGTLALLRAPEQLADLSSHLDDAGVVANAVEEMLRWDGPSVATARVLTESVEFHGQTMASGARVHLFIGAANRDPRIFEQPDDFDIRRANARKHINFGYGIHMCLGARLARMEATIAFPILVRALGNAELTTEGPYIHMVIWARSSGLDRGGAIMPCRCVIRDT
jgi:cytochrome P450